MMGLMRDETSNNHCKSHRLNISLGPFARDERLDRVEHILELLLESRSGSGRYYQRLQTPSFMGLEDLVNYDLMPAGIGLLPAESCSRDDWSIGALVSENDLTPGSATTPAVFRSESRCLSPPARGSPDQRRPNIHL